MEQKSIIILGADIAKALCYCERLLYHCEAKANNPCLSPDGILILSRKFETENKRFATMFTKGGGRKMRTYRF